jgi:hypothetical protein
VPVPGATGGQPAQPTANAVATLRTAASASQQTAGVPAPPVVQGSSAVYLDGFMPASAWAVVVGVVLQLLL